MSYNEANESIYIPRKEYEQRHVTIQLSLTSLAATLTETQKLVTASTGQLSALLEITEKLTTDIAVLKDRMKYLYPALTLAVGVIMFLLGRAA